MVRWGCELGLFLSCFCLKSEYHVVFHMWLCYLLGIYKLPVEMNEAACTRSLDLFNNGRSWASILPWSFVLTECPESLCCKRRRPLFRWCLSSTLTRFVVVGRLYCLFSLGSNVTGSVVLTPTLCRLLVPLNEVSPHMLHKLQTSRHWLHPPFCKIHQTTGVQFRIVLDIASTWKMCPLFGRLLNSSVSSVICEFKLSAKLWFSFSKFKTCLVSMQTFWLSGSYLFDQVLIFGESTHRSQTLKVWYGFVLVSAVTSMETLRMFVRDIDRWPMGHGPLKFSWDMNQSLGCETES